jgi:hypothetical protein
MHGSIGGCWGGKNILRGRWSRAGALEDATTMAWSGPQPQRWLAEPVAYLTNATTEGCSALY